MSASRNDARPPKSTPTPLRGVMRADLRPDLRGERSAERTGEHARGTSTPPRRAATQPRFAAPGPSSKKGARAVLLAAVAGLSAFGVVKVADVVEKTDKIPLRTVVVAGIDPASPRAAEIKAWSELQVGEPFFGVDVAAVAAHVEEHPFVRTAQVHRVPPDTIEIVVEERVARAVARSADGTLYLVDADGELMKQARPSDVLDVPVLSLVDVSKSKAAMSLLDALERADLLSRVSEVVEHPVVGFDVFFDDGAQLRVGQNDFDPKLARAKAVMAQLHESGSAASFMWLDDARHPERVAVRLRPATETSPGGG